MTTPIFWGFSPLLLIALAVFIWAKYCAAKDKRFREDWYKKYGRHY